MSKEDTQQTGEVTERSIPFVADWNGALQLALGSRRGELLRIAPMPDPKDLTPKDMEELRDLIGMLIDTLGKRESALQRASDELLEVEGVLDEIDSTPLCEVRAELRSALLYVREAQRFCNVDDPDAEED